MYTVTALRCTDGKHVSWTTDDERGAKFLLRVLKNNLDWADAKLTKIEGGDLAFSDEEAARCHPILSQ